MFGYIAIAAVVALVIVHAVRIDMRRRAPGTISPRSTPTPGSVLRRPGRLRCRHLRYAFQTRQSHRRNVAPQPGDFAVMAPQRYTATAPDESRVTSRARLLLTNEKVGGQSRSGSWSWRLAATPGHQGGRPPGPIATTEAAQPESTNSGSARMQGGRARWPSSP
jgi:hypothetical protein